MNPRVLITGSSGFIGSAMTRSLVLSGYKVRAAARRKPLYLQSLDIEWMELPDLRSNFDWAPILDGVEAVIHLAAIAHRNSRDSGDYDAVNRLATARLAKASADHMIKRLIFMSSIGAQTGSAASSVVTEELGPSPVTPYDCAKLAAEEAVRRSGVPYTILRPVIVYGPGAKANVAMLKRFASLPLPLPFGAFNNRRSLLSIDNLIDAVKFCLEAPETIDRTFVLADPEPITLARMLSTLREASGRSARLFGVPPALFRVVLELTGRNALWDRLGRELVVSPCELMKLGWSPSVDTETGLRTMMSSEWGSGQTSRHLE